MLCQPRENPSHLRTRLPFPKNHLRHSSPQYPMMIDFGKSKIFKGQMTQPVNGLIWSQGALTNLLEKLANGFSVQAALSIG